MFKNAIIYTFTTAKPLDLFDAEISLGKQLFAPCGPTQEISTGWVPPRGEAHGALIESVGGHWVSKFVIENKSVPGDVIKRHLAERVAKIEQEQSRKTKAARWVLTNAQKQSAH